jgi:ADP-ribosylglycohydrolase
MLGAIAGDVIGSVYEARPIKTPHFHPLFDPFCRFTDDTVLTVALADSLLSGADYGDKLREYFRAYPRAGYGGNFYRWATSGSRRAYGSFGNGSAMRVSPVGHAYDSLEEVLERAKWSADFTHNHPEGVRGAQATAAAVFLARRRTPKAEIKEYLARTFGYDLDRTLDDVRPGYRFDVTCQGTVPEAVLSFLESTGYEDAVRLAVSLGGDSDTLACITGGIAGAYYGVPDEIRAEAWLRLDVRLQRVVGEFLTRYGG